MHASSAAVGIPGTRPFLSHVHCGTPSREIGLACTSLGRCRMPSAKHRNGSAVRRLRRPSGNVGLMAAPPECTTAHVSHQISRAPPSKRLPVVPASRLSEPGPLSPLQCSPRIRGAAVHARAACGPAGWYGICCASTCQALSALYPTCWRAVRLPFVPSGSRTRHARQSLPDMLAYPFTSPTTCNLDSLDFSCSLRSACISSRF